MFDGRVDELQSDELEATLLKTTDDLANESPLDTVGLARAKKRDDQRNRISDEGQQTAGF